jgi:hypothetical protein
MGKAIQSVRYRSNILISGNGRIFNDILLRQSMIPTILVGSCPKFHF